MLGGPFQFCCVYFRMMAHVCLLGASGVYCNVEARFLSVLFPDHILLSLPFFSSKAKNDNVLGIEGE